MRSPDLLVMVSIDGLRAAALDDSPVPLPTLGALAARGVRARALRPVFPSVTWPCHTSIVTGVAPARHGVLGNHVFDRARGEPVAHYGDCTDVPIEVETLWDGIAARGERAAAICWPKTRGSPTLADHIPEFYEQPLFEAYASQPLWKELAAAGLPVHRYGAWSSCRALGPMQDWLTLEAARHVLTMRPPRLLLVHFLTLDSFQHEFGVSSPEAHWALRHVDTLLGRLLDTLTATNRLASTTVMVFGDHGFVDVGNPHHPNQLLREEKLLDLDGDGEITRRHAWVAANGGSAHVYVLDGAPRTTGEHLRERFGALPGITAVGPEDFPALGLPQPREHTAQGDLVLLAAPGHHLTDHMTAEAVAAAPIYRATHGHAPSLPELAAGLVVAGPGLREGVTLGEVSMLDLAPTAAVLLGLGLTLADGVAIEEALAEP